MYKTMKRLGSLLLSAALTLTLAAPALPTASAAESRTTGNTYYVSTVRGSDSYDGLSAEKPWYSLGKINDLDLDPGDQVLLERGSVFENGYLQFDKDDQGSAEAPILIGAYGEGNKPLLNTNGNGIWYQNYGQQLDSGTHHWKDYVSSCILIYDAEYIEVSDIAMTNWGGVENGAVVTGEPGYSYGAKMDRTGVAVVTQDIGTADHIYLKNLDIENIYGNVYDKHMNNGGIYFTVAKPHDEGSTGIARYDDVLIEGNRVVRTSRWGIAAAYTAYHGQFSNMAIPDDLCKKYGATNLVIRNNYLKDTGGDPITTMYAYQPVTEYNVSIGGAREMTSAIYTEVGDRGGRVAAGIWPWKCKTALFQYNECYDMTHPSAGNGDGQAWDADSGDSTIYQYNYSAGNGGGCVMACLQQAYNTVFRYNISYKDGEGTGVLNTCSAPNGKYYNNTFIVAENAKIIRDGMAGGTPVIENNIFYNIGSASRANAGWNNGTPNARYDNNLYYNFSDKPASDANAVQVAAGTALFAGDVSTAPTAPTATGLVHSWDTDFDMFKLAESSPAINAGKAIDLLNGLGGDHGVPPPTKDFYGNALDTVADIGAHDTGTPSLALASNVYAVDQSAKTISNIAAGTTVEDFLFNISVDDGIAVKITDSSGQEVAGSTPMPTGGSVELSWNGRTISYTLAASSDNALKACIYEIRDSIIYVPFTNNNPVSIHEFLSGITIAATASVKVYDGSAEVSNGNLNAGMTFSIIAQDGTSGQTYTIQAKTAYDHRNDWVDQQQGNVWFAQRRLKDGGYVNFNGWKWNDSGDHSKGGWWNGDDPDYTSAEKVGACGDIRPENNQVYKSGGFAYFAPANGKVEISFSSAENGAYTSGAPTFRVAKSDENTGTVHLVITKNGETIHGQDYQIPAFGTYLSVAPFEVEINKGDVIRFEIVNRGGAISGNGGVAMNPVITYMDEAYTDKTPPGTPTDLKTRYISYTDATLTWATAYDNVGVTGYKVYLNDDLKTESPVTGHSYAFTGLAPGTKYTAKVIALDAANNESEPATLTFTTAADTEKPTVPGNVTVSEIGETAAAVTWTASTDNVGVTGYKVYLGDAASPAVSVDGATLTASLTGLTAWTDYTVRVTAVDASGNESEAGTANFKTADTTKPTAPGTVAVTQGSITATGATITWTAATDAGSGLAKYVISYGENMSIDVSKDATAYTLAGLTASTDYTVSIVAVDVAGNTSDAGQTTFTTAEKADDTPPAAPAGLAVTAGSITAHGAAITWNANTEEDLEGYKVYVGDTLKDTVKGTHTYTFAGLEDATEFSVTISAFDTSGNESEKSASVSFTTLDGTAPTVPTAIIVTPSFESAEVTWTASNDNVAVDHYELTINQKARLEPVTTTGTSYHFTELLSDADYTVGIVAVDAAGNRSASGTADFHTEKDTEKPGVPVNAAVSDITANGAVLSWTASTDNWKVGAYKVLNSGEELTSFDVEDLTTGDEGVTLSADLTGLAEYTAYSLTVVAVDAAGNVSDPSAPAVEFTTLDVTAPDTPAPTASDVGYDSATVSWAEPSDNAGVTGYELQLDGGEVIPLTETNYTFEGLMPETEYVVQVRAGDAADNWSEWGSVSFTTGQTPDTTPPSAPTGLTADSVTGEGATLTWEASEDDRGVAGYRVYNGTALTASVSDTTYTLTGLLPDTEYTLSIRAYDAAGNESEAAEVTFRTLFVEDTTPPSAPTGTDYDALNFNSAVLTWTRPADKDLAGYRVYNDGQPYLDLEVSQVVTVGSAVRYTLSGLTSETTYTIAVSAYDKAGNESARSAPALQFTTPAVPDGTDSDPPTAPGEVKAENIGRSGATILWTASIDDSGVISRYELYDGAVQLAFVSGSTTSCTLTGLLPTTTYVVSVYAFDGAGNRSEAGQVTFTTTDGTVAPPPSGGGSSGGGSGSSTTTEKHEDGSTTKTETDKKTGTVTATTKRPDGSVTVVETRKNGVTTVTDTRKDGVKTETVALPDGYVTAAVSVPEKVGKTTVSVPAPKAGPGTVAVLVKPDGTEEVIRLSTAKEGEVSFPVSGDAQIKLVDNSMTFSDVPTDSVYKDAVDFVTARELFTGVGGGRFAPQQSVDRSMMVTVLYRLASGESLTEGLTGAEKTFGDVPSGAWFADAVNWAVENGVTSGTGGGFDPTATLDRQQIAVFLYNFAGKPAVEAGISFADSGDVAPWAADAMSWAVSNGILDGSDDGRLNPGLSTSRAEVARILQNLVNHLAG